MGIEYQPRKKKGYFYWTNYKCARHLYEINKKKLGNFVVHLLLHQYTFFLTFASMFCLITKSSGEEDFIHIFKRLCSGQKMYMLCNSVANQYSWAKLFCIFKITVFDFKCQRCTVCIIRYWQVHVFHIFWIRISVCLSVLVNTSMLTTVPIVLDTVTLSWWIFNSNLIPMNSKLLIWE